MRAFLGTFAVALLACNANNSSRALLDAGTGLGGRGGAGGSWSTPSSVESGSASGGDAPKAIGGRGGTNGGGLAGTGGGAGKTGASGGVGNTGATGGGGTTALFHVGLGALKHLEELPFLDIYAHTMSFSSSDPNLTNEDRDKYLYMDGTEAVLFEAEGPGIIYRWWHTSFGPSGEYHLYFDGAKTPSLVLKQPAFWGATISPFLSPYSLTNSESSGGWVTYFPIPFAKSLRITSVGGPGLNYYNFAYTRYVETPISSFTGLEVDDRVIEQLTHPGDSPIAPTAADKTTIGTMDLAAGATGVLANLAGPGAIVGLTIRAGAGVPIPALQGSTRLQIFWDGEASPSVDSPVGDFFVMTGTQSPEVRGLVVGHKGDALYCYFPMPFQTSAKVQLTNTSSVNLTGLGFEIVSRPLVVDFGQIGYFHAVRNAGMTVNGKDHVMLDVKGSGRFVGVNMFLPRSGVTLEGNERIYVDGARSPAINGTGIEDYFNAGWYFKKGAFSTPTHGAPTFAENAPFNAYRFHLSDSVPFTSSIRVSIQHGENDNDVPSSYSSVAYFYLNPAPKSRVTDHLDIGDDSSITQHKYAVTGQAGTPTVSSRFISDDPTVITGTGRTVTGKSSFVVLIDPRNKGVTLRRLLDQSIGRQSASVLVDGVSAGMWKTPGSNMTFRWREDDFWIPAALTAGKDHLQITISSDGVAWNEFAYDVLSLLP